MDNEIGGVWRTIAGRRVFIKDGQSLSSAMKESGKFNSSKKDKNNGETAQYITNEEYEKIGEELNSKLAEDEKRILNMYVDTPMTAASSELNAGKNRTMNWYLDEEGVDEHNRRKVGVKELLDIKKDNPKLYSLQSEYVRRYIDRVAESQQKIDKIFQDKGITLEKDIVVYRKTRESAEEIKNGFTKYGYVSTTINNSLPKKMPSGEKFGDNDIDIIIPKGTKVLPLRKVIESQLHTGIDSMTEKAITGVAKQNEILLPRGSSFEFVKYNEDKKRWVVVLRRKQ